MNNNSKDLYTSINKRIVMKNNKIIFLFLIFALLSMTYIVQGATVTLSPIDTGADINGTKNTITVSIALTGNNRNVTNVTFYYRTSSTDSWIAFATNGSGGVGGLQNLTAYSNNFDVSGLTDGESYELNSTAFNDTNMAGLIAIGSTTTTSIDIDNGNPTTPILNVDRTQIEPLKSVELSCTSTDTGDSTLTFLLHLAKPDNQGGTLSLKANQTEKSQNDQSYTATFDAGSTDILGIYSATCMVIDDVGKYPTNSTSIEITVKSEDDEVIGGGGINTSIFSGAFSIIISIAGGLLFILIIAVIFLQSSKKKGRRR